MQLYIHVPFCRQKCAYCAFYSVDLRQEAQALAASAKTGHTVYSTQTDHAFTSPQKDHTALLDHYCQTLITEIGQRAHGQTAPISSIFFGGGTPSLLSSRHLDAILNAIQRHYPLASNIEITVEANPESAVRPHWLKETRAAGVNRLSLGIQSFTDNDLALLGRCHNARQAHEAVHLAHEAQFSSISLDLMWALPWTNHEPRLVSPTAHWLATLTAALNCSPQHISAYGLILEEGTPLAQWAEQPALAKETEQDYLWNKSKRNDATEQAGQSNKDWQKGRGLLVFPTEEEEKAMYLEGIELLAQHGFKHYEISNYALPGHQCRHNIGYWQGCDYLGFGPAAVSTLGTTRLTNVSNFERWAAGVRSGHSHYEAEELSSHVLQQEKVMLSLRMAQGLALDDWNAISHHPLHTLPFARQLITDGLATLTRTADGERFALTSTGMLVSNAIISRFFEAMPND